VTVYVSEVLGNCTFLYAHGLFVEHRLASFMNYDLGYIDLEEKTLQPLENPFGPKV